MKGISWIFAIIPAFLAFLLSSSMLAQEMNHSDTEQVVNEQEQSQRVFLQQVSFSATPADGKVVLSWKVDAQFLNRYFFLERSLNGEAFTVITEFSGRGAVDSRQNFRFEDGMISNGETYIYRLASLGEDNRVVYHHTKRAMPSVGLTELKTAQTQ